MRQQSTQIGQPVIFRLFCFWVQLLLQRGQLQRVPHLISLGQVSHATDFRCRWPYRDFQKETVLSFLFPVLSGGNTDSIFETFNQMLSPYGSMYNLYDIFNFQKDGIFDLLKMANAYNFFYVLFTVFFCYFYTAITFNPVDTADNLKRVGAFIPGRRPGKNTSDYIDYVLSRITVVGATFLVVVALMPNIMNVSFGVGPGVSQLVGGTGLIIVAGVMLDLMKQIESQLLMRHYDGFKYRGPRTGGGSSNPKSPRGPGASSGRTLGGGRKR